MAKGAKYDVVVFGASGFTGLRVCEELHRAVTEGASITWAGAGRSSGKIKLSIDFARNQAGVIEANVRDEASLVAMAKAARVVINCVGPFHLYGEPVVKACVETGTDYVDVTGEPYFMEQMVQKYGAQAEKSGAVIVNACGFDCIPADCMALRLREMFAPGALSQVEMTHAAELGTGEGSPGNYGTWDSLVRGLANAADLRKLRKEVRKGQAKVETVGPRLPKKTIFKDSTGAWCVPFLGADRSVVTRSNHAFAAGDSGDDGAPSFAAYMRVGSMLRLAVVMIWGLWFMAWSKLPKVGQKLLLKYPRFFSWGAFSFDGPSPELRASTTFVTTMVGKGWADPPEAVGSTRAFDRKVELSLTLRDPGYTSTAQMLCASALTVLNDRNAMPKGGVLTPAVAFRNTSIFDNLVQFGINIEVTSDGGL